MMPFTDLIVIYPSTLPHVMAMCGLAAFARGGFPVPEGRQGHSKTGPSSGDESKPDGRRDSHKGAWRYLIKTGQQLICPRLDLFVGCSWDMLGFKGQHG